MVNKRYLLFAYDDTYPCGGWSDFVDGYTSLAAAQEAGGRQHKDHWEVVDLASMQVVASGPDDVADDEVDYGQVGQQGVAAVGAYRPWAEVTWDRRGRQKRRRQ
ncbi:MAG: hypothetical protein FJW34_16810 [Acidobacteria bacterium]|nr:hypothetical protein [Acidobacteriota bacterium]